MWAMVIVILDVLCYEDNPKVRVDPTSGATHQLTALTFCSPF